VVEETVAKKVAGEFRPERILMAADDIPMVVASLMRNKRVNKPVQNSTDQEKEKKAGDALLEEFNHQISTPEKRRVLKKLIKQTAQISKDPAKASQLKSLLMGKQLLDFSDSEKRLVINLILIRETRSPSAPAPLPPKAPPVVEAPKAEIPKVEMPKAKFPKALKALGILGAAGLAGYGGYKLYKHYQKKPMEKKAGPILNWVLHRLEARKAKLEEKEARKVMRRATKLVEQKALAEKRPGPELTPTKKGPMPVNEMTGM
jgi:hypothetical protein